MILQLSMTDLIVHDFSLFIPSLTTLTSKII